MLSVGDAIQNGHDRRSHFLRFRERHFLGCRLAVERDSLPGGADVHDALEVEELGVDIDPPGVKRANEIPHAARWQSHLHCMEVDRRHVDEAAEGRAIKLCCQPADGIFVAPSPLGELPVEELDLAGYDRAVIERLDEFAPAREHASLVERLLDTPTAND